ncbi:uncharacterized protein [Mytilus edulis]|uniref:uncharacterized protein isoform X1 n=1 Tax=Mytilus edulis TaxID=6550 RepID=UPI0039F13B84
MCKLSLLSSMLFGLVICQNDYPDYEEMCHAIKNNTIGQLQCPDNKSIVIKRIGFASDNCSSDAFQNSQNIRLLTNITCNNMSTCTLPFSDKRTHFLNIGFQCKVEKCHAVKNNTTGKLQCPDDKSIVIKRMGLANKNCSPDGFLNLKNIRLLTNITCINRFTCTLPFYDRRYNFLNIGFHCKNRDSDNQTHTSETETGNRTHTSKNDRGNQTHTPENDSGNRNYTPYHESGNGTYTTVFQTMKNPCSVCSTAEKCLTVQKDTENSITCSNDQRINISMAWVDKSDCNDIRFIARNVIFRTHDLSSLCSGHSNCSVYFQSHVVGVLNILYSCNDERHSSKHMEKSSNKQVIGGAVAGGVTIIAIVFLLIGVYMIRRCRSKNYQDSHARSEKKMNDSNQLQLDQEINRQRTYTATSPCNTTVYSTDNYDYLQNKEDKGKIYSNGKDTNYTYTRNSSTYDHIQNREGMRNQQTKTMEMDVYSHLKGIVPVSDVIYDHTLRDGIRDNCEGDYDVSHGILTDDDYDVSGNFNQSQVKNTDSMYN